MLLDGLDEVIDESQQARVLDEVGRWAHASAANWFVLTCRVAGWQTNWLPGFRVCEVQEFDRDDVRRFIGAWYREVLRTEKANALGVELRPEQLQAAETKAFAEARERRWGPDDHPVTKVDWHEALAYAEWLGCSLPSEAEWEKAARGPDGRRWPWGNEWVEGRANVREWGWWRRWGRMSRAMAEATTPVGRFSPAGDSPYGCRDMAGNVWEWTRNLWGHDAREPSFGYPYQGGDGREDRKASAEILRVLRGGSVIYASRSVRCAYRSRYTPDDRRDLIGFRVVLLPFSSGL